ncbi:polysaccharide deacetylase [Verticiella sediminum]|uniref:Polysaccharide deacetylase n=1 Tax=Verticiella sediminum TaxID=1247510 RepID=A0A556AE73_9BURK|nr:polysaccharide deacetylase family protein [Verticiella sediminum]TSH91192.1 polysaccharide deacetylase [Verticiella sediminum]
MQNAFITDRFDHSAEPDRPPMRWPNGARVALWVAPNIEHYEYLPRHVRVRDPWPRTPHPDMLGYGIRDWGNRVGIWRFMELFDRLRLRCTVSLSMSVLDMYPEIAEAMLGRRWELLSHGLYNTRYHWSLPEDEERAAIAECLEIHRRVAGSELQGWFSPAASNTLATPDLVAEAGLRYLCDLYHDDEPTRLKVRGGGTLWSLPYSMEINDTNAWRRGQEATAFAQKIRDEFDTLYAEGERRCKVMNIALHPFIMGQPHRIGALESAFEYILSHDGVWCATGSEIIDAFERMTCPST